ncbi:MAG: transcriptional repressor [Ruminococcus sp.]|nr:transcriptional repressor [Ruminococcus sp.]
MKKDSGYNTTQKEKLLDFLINNNDKHTSAQEIDNYLRSVGSPVGMATIYRQLDRLVEAGTVRKFVIDGKTSACYQYIDNKQECQEHFHLKCRSCGKLIHLNCNKLMDINSHIAQHHGFIVDSSQTVFYGICADCASLPEE